MIMCDFFCGGPPPYSGGETCVCHDCVPCTVFPAVNHAVAHAVGPLCMDYSTQKAQQSAHVHKGLPNWKHITCN